MLTEKQKKFLRWEFGVFFHFGIRTFYKGSRDWDGTVMSPEKFDPVDLDCGSWLDTAKAAGAKYAVMTAKHHDGFALWPSAHTSFSVKNSPWKDGKGDVVREFTDACRERGMGVGLYCSAAQAFGDVSFSDAAAYDDFFIAQLRELLTGYGKIDYLWFDACGSAGHVFDEKRIIAAIRECQPDILIFGMWDPDTRWVGNEDGFADDPCFYFEFSEGRYRTVPAECDCKLRSTWFDCEYNADTIKTVDELMGMYEYSIGRGQNLLLNLGPNERGRLNEDDAERLTEFGEAIRAKYGHPADFRFDPKRNALTADEPAGVSWVRLEGDLDELEREGFRLYAHLPEYRTKRILIFEGHTLGRSRICTFPYIKTGCIEFEGSMSVRDMSAGKQNG